MCVPLNKFPSIRMCAPSDGLAIAFRVFPYLVLWAVHLSFLHLTLIFWESPGSMVYTAENLCSIPNIRDLEIYGSVVRFSH